MNKITDPLSKDPTKKSAIKEYCAIQRK